MPAMAALACSNCGRPLRLSVQQPAHADCSACGARTALPPDVARRLAVVGAELRAVEVGLLQVSKHQLQRIRVQEAALIGVAAFDALIVVLILFEVGRAIPSGLARKQVLDLIGAGFVVLLASIPFVIARRYRTRFELAFAAQPPLVPGGKAAAMPAAESCPTRRSPGAACRDAPTVAPTTSSTRRSWRAPPHAGARKWWCSTGEGGLRLVGTGSSPRSQRSGCSWRWWRPARSPCSSDGFSCPSLDARGGRRRTRSRSKEQHDHQGGAPEQGER